MKTPSIAAPAAKPNFGETRTQRYGAFLFLVAMFAANCLFTRNFFSINTVWLLIIQSCPIVLTGLGMTFVIASGGIDISVGATMALSGTVLAQLMVKQAMPLWFCMTAALVVAAAVGAFNGYVIARFRVQPIVITLIMMLVARGLAQVVTNGSPIPFSKMPINTLVTYRFWKQGMPVQLVVLLAMTLLVSFVMRRSVFGTQVQASGDNLNASRLAGIDTFRVTVMVYVICALCVGLASIIEVGRESQAEAARMGLNIEMNSIAAVAIGGTPMDGGRAKVWGTVTGALIMQMVGMTVNMNGILSSWGIVFKAAILIIAVYFQRDRAKA